MPYSTIVIVRGLLPKGVKVDDSTTDPPTEAVVIGTILPGIAADIDVAILSGGGSLPISPTDTTSLAFLSMLESREAVYQILVQRGTAEDPKHKPLWKEWHERYVKILEAIAEGEILSSLADDNVPWSYTRDADTTDPSDSRNPVVTRDYDA